MCKLRPTIGYLILENIGRHMKSNQKLPDAMIGSLADQLLTPSGKTDEEYFKIRKAMSSSLLEIFTSLKAYFPIKKSLNVISIAAGVPDEFIALLAFYSLQGTTINFIGVDSDFFSNALSNYSFVKFSHQFRLLTCDASNPKDVQHALTEAKALPEKGFDLVFLRHPDVLTTTRAQAFKSMIQSTIPFVAAADSKVFMTCYYKQEIDEVFRIIDAQPKPVFFKPGLGNCCILDSTVKINIDNTILELNKFSMVFTCEGSFYNSRMKTAIKDKFASARRQECKETHTMIKHSELATPYIESLSQCIKTSLQKNSMFAHDSKKNIVIFANSWLKQLSEPALNELSTELAGQYYHQPDTNMPSKPNMLSKPK